MLELNVFYSIHFGWTGINEFSVAIGGQFWMNYLVDLNFDLNIQKKWTKQFGLIPKQKISFSVGIVPVWFDFWANMGIEAYAELTAQFQASMRNNYKKSIWIGTSYTSGSGWDKYYKTGTDGMIFRFFLLILQLQPYLWLFTFIFQAYFSNHHNLMQDLLH